MKIGMVLHKPFPPDIRVEKEARSLVAAGHGVFLLALGRSGEPTVEIVAGFVVVRLPPPHPFRRRLNWLGFYGLAPFHDYYWAHRIEKFVQKTGIEALHVHDLPLLSTTLAVARPLGIPVVADLHENYPEMVKACTADSRNPLVWFSDNRLRWALHEGGAVRRADRIITIVEEEKERYYRRYGIPRERITVVMNLVDPEYFTRLRPSSGTGDRKTFTITYVGGIGPHRGVDTAIQAMTHLRDRMPEARLRIIGATSENRAGLERLVAAEHVTEMVEIMDWVSFEQVPDLIRASEVCLVPFHRTPHTDIALPHKLFQYMLLGRPVVVSDCPVLKRVVEETGGGLVFQGGDPADLAGKLVCLHDDNDLWARCGANGIRSVRESYNWQREARKLVAMYADLAMELTERN